MESIGGVGHLCKSIIWEVIYWIVIRIPKNGIYPILDTLFWCCKQKFYSFGSQFKHFGSCFCYKTLKYRKKNRYFTRKLFCKNYFIPLNLYVPQVTKSSSLAFCTPAFRPLFGKAKNAKCPCRVYKFSLPAIRDRHLPVWQTGKRPAWFVKFMV